MTAGDDNWTSGLGQRAAALPPPPPDEDDAFEQPIVQRTVDAATAPSAVPRNAFHLPFLRPSSGAEEATDVRAANEEPHEEKTMPKTEPKTARRGRPTKHASARFQICALLMAKGDLTREQLLEDVNCDGTAFRNAIFNAKAAEHITFIEKTSAYRITKEGKAWTTGGANLDNHKGAGAEPVTSKPRAPKATKRSEAPPPPSTHALTVRTFEPVVERSFRCGAFSDGGFHLAKNGQAIDLTPAEYDEMRRYQRAFEQLAAR